ncbi:smad nuclear-interacting protein 1 [Stylonychia lemnae]|uniref:Smad nuclear-interacting protein 1 n=1 Tax=Stylonychia lemnae TaxID=5949 RepID=A0A078AXQ0_STYLE|nr:smad nuclear-interacting protein 1 [Stylonychia lemnae]|eukprot:CDW85578.1 smad nuclear-interacting protein 1 [Stylonychia lemnae]
MSEFEELSFKTRRQDNKKDKETKEEEKVEKELPCFEPSGILAEFQNQYKGVVLKFTEPLDAAVPTNTWKIYPFKGEEELKEQAARGVYMGIIQEMVIVPYLMDLESTNKTMLNGDAIEPARYYELREKDVITFGESKREYVIMKLN